MISDDTIKQLADQIEKPVDLEIAIHQIRDKVISAYVERKNARSAAEPVDGDFSFEVTLPSRPTERMIEMMRFMVTKPNRDQFREQFPMKPRHERGCDMHDDWSILWNQGIIEYQAGHDHFQLTLMGEQLLRHLNGGFATGGVLPVSKVRIGLAGEHALETTHTINDPNDPARKRL